MIFGVRNIDSTHLQLAGYKMQPIGDSALALILLTSEAAQTVRHEKNECEKIARRSRMIGACLRQLQNFGLLHNPGTRKLVEMLQETLSQIYKLVRVCQSTSIIYYFNFGKLANQFREVHSKIDIYLAAFASISQVYLACHFAGATGHASLAQVQVNYLALVIIHFFHGWIWCSDKFFMYHCWYRRSNAYSQSRLNELIKALLHLRYPLLQQTMSCLKELSKAHLHLRYPLLQQAMCSTRPSPTYNVMV